MHQRFALVSACLILAAPPAASLCAQTSHPASAPLQQTLDDLAANDFAARQRAADKLRDLLAAQLRQQADLQQLVDQLTAALADDLKLLGRTVDPEARPRVAGLLDIQHGLLLFTLKALHSPTDECKELLNWGYAPGHVAIVARVYSRHVKTRLEGIKDLKNHPDPGVDRLLACLVDDEEEAVRAQALAVAWECKPSAPLVEALWQRAVTRLESDEAGELQEEFEIAFPGRSDTLTFSHEIDSANDSTLAADVLAHWQAPETADRLRRLLQERMKSPQLTLPDSDLWIDNVRHLAVAHKLKEAIPFFARLVLQPRDRGNESADNGVKYYWTPRTDALGALLQIADMPADDYQLSRHPNPSDESQSLWAASTEAAESAAVQRFHTWWKAHYQQYGGIKPPDQLPKAEDEVPPHQD